MRLTREDGFRFFLAVIGGAIGVLLAVWFVSGKIILQNDTWWQIVAGRDILAGHWPVTNTWSWSLPNVKWMVQEPLFDVLEAFASRWGYYGLSVLTIVFVLASMAFLWDYLKRKLPGAWGVILLASFPLSTVFFWECRPQMSDYLGLVFLVWAVDRKLYWPIPLAVVLWANLHSGVVLAPVVLFLLAGLSWLPSFESGLLSHAPGDRMKLTGTVISSFAATLVTHNGIGVWVYALKTIFTSSSFGQNIQEWAPPPLGSSIVHAEFWLLAMAPLVLSVLFKRKLHLDRLVLFLVFYFLALGSYRWTPYAVITWVFLIADMIPDREEPISWKGMTLALCMAGAFVSASIGYGLPSQSLISMAKLNGYPVEAVQTIRADGFQHVYNDYAWGGFLIYEGIPVYIDGRGEVYEWDGKIFDEYAQTERLKKVKMGGSITALLIKDSPLSNYLMALGWTTVQQGNDYVLLRKGG